MKNTLIAITAILPVIVLAKPFDTMSAEEIKAADKDRWGDRVSLAGKSGEELGRLIDNLRTLTERLAACSDEAVLLQPSKLDVLKELSNTLAKQLVTDNVGLLPEPDDPPNFQRGYERLNSFKVMLHALERKSRMKLRILVTDVIGFQMVERRAKWSSVQSRLDSLKTTEMFRELDTAYESFMHNVDLLIRRNVTDVTGSELLMVSKLGKFTNNDCKSSPSLDGRARVVDRYLLVMNSAALNTYNKYATTIKMESSDALNTLAEDHDFYQQYALKLLPADRKLVEKFFKEVSRFLDQIDNFVVKESEKLIKNALDLSSEVGRLRFCTGFSPNKAFFASGPAKDDGCQGYARRVRVMLEDCKKRYMQHLDSMRSRYNNNPDKHIPNGWQ